MVCLTLAGWHVVVDLLDSVLGRVLGSDDTGGGWVPVNLRLHVTIFRG